MISETAGHIWINNLGNYVEWPGKLADYEFPNASTPFWQSEETEVAIEKIQKELNPKRRDAYVRELAQVYRSPYSHVPLVYAPKMHGVNKKVGEWPPSRNMYYKKNISSAKFMGKLRFGQLPKRMI